MLPVCWQWARRSSPSCRVLAKVKGYRVVRGMSECCGACWVSVSLKRVGPPRIEVPTAGRCQWQLGCADARWGAKALNENRDECPFCDRIGGGEFIAENDDAVAFADKFPVSQGHALVVPRSHVTSLFELPEGESDEVWRLVSVVRRILEGELAPDGFNVGLNDGEAAGQTVGHAHVHVIPRHAGDVPDPRGGVRWVFPDKAAY